MLSRNRTQGLVLSFEERKQFATFIVLLARVHKRTQNNKKNSKKRREAKYKLNEKGPQIRGLTLKLMLSYYKGFSPLLNILFIRANFNSF